MNITRMHRCRYILHANEKRWYLCRKRDVKVLLVVLGLPSASVSIHTREMSFDYRPQVVVFLC